MGFGDGWFSSILGIEVSWPLSGGVLFCGLTTRKGTLEEGADSTTGTGDGAEGGAKLA